MKRFEAVAPVLVCPEGLPELERRAISIFAEEISLRTGLELAQSPVFMPGVSNAVITTESRLGSVCPQAARALSRLEAPGAEGFRLFFSRRGDALSLFAVGRDARGAMYAMGKLLRLLRLFPGRIEADALFSGLSSTPRYPLHGHQLAYRDKQNTLPCWTEREFDRYIRDLLLFGSNAIELLPPRTDDNLYSRKMRRDPFELMVRLEKIVHAYGMDLWLWYPNMGADYGDPKVLEAELLEREKVFSALGSVEGMLVPAGDPGELEPDELFPVTEKCVKILHKYHPSAKVYLAPQSFAPQPGWYDAFYRHVSEQPDWLYGVCFAPWEQQTIEEMRARLPDLYKGRIRHYPDITHNYGCQFALPHWDNCFAIVEGRECYNARPRAMKAIHNHHAPCTVGSITYSEGIHDDVNKFVWGQQDWDDRQDAEETVREYVRLFIDPALEDELTRALMGLEENWDCEAPIEENEAVGRTCALWRDIDARASDAVRRNFRYQMGLMRALADEYIRGKRRYDARLEGECKEALARAEEWGADEAMRRAKAILNRGIDEPHDPQLRARLQRMADELHRSCGIKLTTARSGGQRWGRGAWMDMIDTPLSDAQYLSVTMKAIRHLPTEAEKRAAIAAMLRRTDPGEGGVYVNLGSAKSRALLSRAHDWADDPGLLRTAFTGIDGGALTAVHEDTGTYRERAVPWEMLSRAFTYYDVPLTVTVPGLDPAARYRLRVGYSAQRWPSPVRLTLSDGTVLHEEVPAHDADVSYEYDLPAEAYADGRLALTWQAHGQVGGAGVNELFLLRTR